MTPVTRICLDTHPEAPDLRCWISTKSGAHDGDHFTVLPNRDTNIPTRPQVAYWPNGGTSDNALNHDDPAGGSGPGPRRAGQHGPVPGA